MLLNESQVVEKWTPTIKQLTGLNESAQGDSQKIGWMSKYAHYHFLNEAAMGGVSSPYSTLYNVPGVGNAVPAQMGAMTANQQLSPDAKGSGDKWPALLPMALQVAARTVGFDLVNVIPMPGPTGVISYLDYVYAGGKQPYGATPAHDPASANPTNTTNFESVNAFKLASDASLKTYTTTKGAGVKIVFKNAGGQTVETNFIGKARMDGYPKFRTGTFTGAANLADVFDGTAVTAYQADGSTFISTITSYPTVVSTLEDHIQGYTGSGADNTDAWSGTFVDGTKLYEPMDRATGEMTYAKPLGLQVFTKFVQVGTYSVSVSVTQEQIQDLNKQWGIDVIAMVENAGINEISQSINKHITSRLFAMGWLNHTNALAAENINLNLDLTNTTNSLASSPAYAVPTESGTATRTMELPKYAVYGNNSFENQDTAIKRIMALIMQAGNVIMQRGRRGPANAIVTNIKIAGAIQSNAQYTFSPITNTFSQNNGSLYPLGTIAGMTLYVDPNMQYEDTRVLVLRKGATDEPGVVFAPYLMAESVKLITEGTGAPKVIIKSRYALVDAGFHPETQYMTMHFKTHSGALI